MNFLGRQLSKIASLHHYKQTKLVLVIFAMFTFFLYAPFVIKGGLQYDDWSAAGLSQACPGIIESFQCYWPNYSDRPLASLYYSINSNLFHSWAPGYILMDTLAWIGGILFVFAVLNKRFGLSLAAPFLFIAAIPALSSTTIFSPATQSIGSFTFLLWAVSFYLLDKHLRTGQLKPWLFSYSLLFTLLLLYESSLPLFAISVLWPILVRKAGSGFTYWKKYFKKFILPVLVILLAIFLYQNIVVLHFFESVSKVRIQDYPDILDFAMRIWANTIYIFTIGLTNLSLQAIFKLPNFGFWTVISTLVLCLIAAPAFFSTFKRKKISLPKGAGITLGLMLILILLGIALLHFIANSPPTIVGYRNRAMVAGSIVVALAAALFWQRLLSKNTGLKIIGFMCFVAYLASFVVQRDNYIAANFERLRIQDSAIRQIEAVNQSNMFVLADIPIYTANNFNDETIYSDEILDWGNSIVVKGHLRVKGISLSSSRINRGELIITDKEQLQVMHDTKHPIPLDRIWLYSAANNQLEKIKDLRQLKSILDKELTESPPPQPVDAIMRNNLRSWLYSY